MTTFGQLRDGDRFLYRGGDRYIKIGRINCEDGTAWNAINCEHGTVAGFASDAPVRPLPPAEHIEGAFLTVLDGVTDFDINRQTGLPLDECEEIINVRDKLQAARG